MARQFRQITARFWTGQTAVRMRKQRIETRAVAFYLATAPTSHMTGLYYITIPTIAGDLGITTHRVSKALKWLCDDGYCRWDDDSSVIWVTRMAHHQIGATLDPRDNRFGAVLDQLREFKHSPLVGAFVGHYCAAYGFADAEGLGELAAYVPRPEPNDPDPAPAEAPSEPPGDPRPSPSEAPSKPPRDPLASPSEAPSKPLGDPLRSQRAENRDQGTEIREQDSGESERAESLAASRARCTPEPGSLSGPSPPCEANPLLQLAEPVSSEHPEREPCVAALWAYQNQLRAGVDPSQPPVPAERAPGGNWDPVRRALAKYPPAALVTALANAAIEAQCKRDLDDDPLEYFNGETNWRATQLRRLLATTPDAIRKRYRRKQGKKARESPNGRPRGPAQPHPPEAYAGGRVEL